MITTILCIVLIVFVVLVVYIAKSTNKDDRAEKEIQSQRHYRILKIAKSLLAVKIDSPSGSFLAGIDVLVVDRNGCLDLVPTYPEGVDMTLIDEEMRKVKEKILDDLECPIDPNHPEYLWEFMVTHGMPYVYFVDP